MQNNKTPQYAVSHYMHTKVITASSDITLKEAVEIMLKSETNGLVVVDKEQRVVGILSSWDIIQYIVPDYLEEDRHLASFEAGDIFFSRIQDTKDHPIEKFMTHHVHVVHPDSSLIEAAALLSEHRIRQLPVVDEHGVLVGYLSRTNIKKAIGDGLGLKP